MGIPAWQYAVSMAAYIIFLMFMVHFMRKHIRFALIFWIIVPIVVISGLTVGVFEIPGGWFRWAKTFSVLVPTAVVGIIRVANYEKKEGWWKLFRRDWVYWFFYVILFLNIAEATAKDATLHNYANALSGFILCATIPFPPKYWKITKKEHGDLVAYTTVAWNFLYTSWNACFVFAENPGYFASSVCILLAAELYPLFIKRPEVYITARVYTLAFHMLARVFFVVIAGAHVDIFTPVMGSASWSNLTVLKWWGLANAAMHVPYLFWYLWQLHARKDEVSFVKGKGSLADA
jgi:hypothetical protein